MGQALVVEDPLPTRAGNNISNPSYYLFHRLCTIQPQAELLWKPEGETGHSDT